MNNAAHRMLWTSLALLLVIVGTVGLVMSLGGMPGTDTDAPLLWSALVRWWHATAPWSTLTVALLGVLLALLGYRLLNRELHAPGGPITRNLLLSTGHRHLRRAGLTRLRAGVLRRGLERDLTRDQRVREARVVLAGTPARPELWIQLRLADARPSAAVHGHVDAAVDRFVLTSGLRPAYLDITVSVDPGRECRPAFWSRSSWRRWPPR